MKIVRDHLARKKKYFVASEYQAKQTTGNSATAIDSDHFVYQANLYPFAEFMAERLGCDTIIGIGHRCKRELLSLHPKFNLIGIDFGESLLSEDARFSSGAWLEWDMDHQPPPQLDKDVLRKAVIVCADVIEYLDHPEYLLNALCNWMAESPFALLSTLDRDRKNEDRGDESTDNLYQIRGWNRDEFNRLLTYYNIPIEFIGYQKNAIVAVVKRRKIYLLPLLTRPRALAILGTYNEKDIVACTVSKLLEQGLYVYAVDNWSTDGTYELLNQLKKGNPKVIGVERFLEAPNKFYQWKNLLRRKEEIARQFNFDWYLHVDADEIRCSPWKEKSLLDAIQIVDQEGYNAIDFTVINFYPVNGNDFPDGADPEDYFVHFDFGHRPGHFKQVKAWKNLGQNIDLTSSGGHDVDFAGRKVFPFKFLVKHYSFRSQKQGEQKIRDSLERSVPEYEELRWHTHWRLYLDDHKFYKDPKGLFDFTEGFYDKYLIERLSGVGLNVDKKSI